MSGSRSKGALALGVVLAALLLIDLYKAEFGTPQHQPLPVTTVGVSPQAPASTSFTRTTPAQQLPGGPATEPGATTPSLP